MTEYLKTSEVARIFRVHPGTVWSWVKKGILHPVRFHGSTWYLYPTDQIRRTCIARGIEFPKEFEPPTSPSAPEIGRERWAWLAGILDCDGTVCMFKHKRKEASRPFAFELNLQITNTSRPFLERIRTEFGGALCGPFGPYKGHQKPYYMMSFSSRKIREFLPRVIPYLIVKKERAKLLLEASRLIHLHFGGVPREYEPRLYEIYDRLKELNRRGSGEALS